MKLSQTGRKIYSETKRIINDAMDNEQLVLFVGAGASVDSGMPLWGKAIDEIARKMVLAEKQKDTLKIPQYYFNSRGKKEYTQLMRDIFRYEDHLLPTKLHKKILDFHTATIVTTNYDNLIELAAEENGEFIRVISQDIDMPYRKSRRELIKMHGDFEHDNFVLKEDDYLNYSRNFRLIETYVKSLIGSKVVLFIGYSLNDPDVKHIISWVKDVLKDDFQRAYLILTKTEPNDIEKEYFRNLGVNLIYSSELVETDEEEMITHSQELIEVIDYLLFKEQGSNLDVLYDELKPFEDLNYVYGKYLTKAFRKHDIICGDDETIDFLHLDKKSDNRLLWEAIWSVIEKRECEDGFDKEKIISIIQICEKSRFTKFIKSEGHKVATHELNNTQISMLEKMIFRFDYEGLRDLLERNNSKLSIDNPDLYMQQAFVCAFLYDFYSAYNYLKVASKSFYARKSYTWYFIAELNRKYVGQLALSPFLSYNLKAEEKNTFEAEVKAIDLDRVLNSIPDMGNDSNAFLLELKNFTISYTLFYNVYADSLKTNEQASTAYSFFAGTFAYQSLRTKIRDFDRYETSNYIILDRFTENKSIFDLYIRTILSSINASNISIEFPDEICGNIKADFLTDFDLYVILRYMQRNDLIKYFKEYGVKKIPICDDGKTYLNDVCKSICDESKRQRYTIFASDRFWSYLELICHTDISEDMAKIVLRRLLEIRNEADVRTYKDSINRFVQSICDEKHYKNQEVCDLVNVFINKVIEFVIADKAISGIMSSTVISMLYFLNKGEVKYNNLDFIRKLVEDDYRSLLFEIYHYLDTECQVSIKEKYKTWRPQKNNAREYYQYCDGVLSAAIESNLEIEQEIMQWILNGINTVVEDTTPIVISHSINHIDVMKHMINLFLSDKIYDIELLKSIVRKSDDEMSKWLLDLEGFDYGKFQCKWLTLCHQGLIDSIAGNRIARESIISVYKEQYGSLTDSTKINDIIIKNFVGRH